MDSEITLITSPSVDVTGAEAVLDELEAVLSRHGCVLIHAGDATVLARITGLGQAVHIAKVYEITPGRIAAKLAWRGLIDKRVAH